MGGEYGRLADIMLDKYILLLKKRFLLVLPYRVIIALAFASLLRFVDEESLLTGRTNYFSRSEITNSNLPIIIRQSFVYVLISRKKCFHIRFVYIRPKEIFAHACTRTRARTHACTRIRARTHMHTHTRADTCMNTHTRADTHKYTQTRADTCMDSHACTHIHASARANTRTRAQFCTYAVACHNIKISR